METQVAIAVTPNVSPLSTALAALMLLLCVHLITNVNVFHKGFPVIGIKGVFSHSQAKKTYTKSAQSILADGYKHTGGPFQVMTEGGVKIVLPSGYMNEIKSDKRFSSDEALRRNFMADLPGFDGFHAATHDNILQATIKTKITQGLGAMMEDFLDETKLAATDFFGKPSDWQEVKPFTSIYLLVARVSSRIFMGQKLCRNASWLEIACTYTAMAFGCAQALRPWPEFLRPYVIWLLPDCRRLRASVRDARRILGPEIDRRKAQYQDALKAGEHSQKEGNVITMFLDVAKGRDFDLVQGQLAMASAAMHTTTDLAVQILYDLCDHPQYFAPLREEIALVHKKYGWQKATLQELKFMDSLMKETQRLSPIGQTAVQRVPVEDVKLSDGTVVPKGSHVVVYNDGSRNPQVFEDPEKFDPYRFLKMREEPGKANSSQFVSTSPSHLGFGHGIHACPGRFFAANEIKIILAHLVMNYDWKFAEGQNVPKRLTVGADFVTNPDGRLEYRQRENPIANL